MVDPIAARAAVASTTARLLAANGDSGALSALSIEGNRVTVSVTITTTGRRGNRDGVGYCDRRRRRTTSLRSSCVHNNQWQIRISIRRSTVVGSCFAHRCRRRSACSARHRRGQALRSRLTAAWDDGSLAMVRRMICSRGHDGLLRVSTHPLRWSTCSSVSHWSVGWICAAVLIYTVSDELVFQLRHGMPSAGRRRLGGLGLLGRKLATVFVAVLPLAISASPALAGAGTARAAVGAVRHRVADLGDPDSTVLTVPLSDATTVTSPLGSDWSMVEVKRGDSVWAIAERVAGDRDIAAIAEQIVAANLGTVMNDGHRFSTPALIEPGWLLNVPVAAARGAVVPVMEVQPSSVSATDSYVVVVGDSYWEIAEDHLGSGRRSSRGCRFHRGVDAHQRAGTWLLRQASDSTR